MTEARKPAQSELMGYRPVSQMLQLFVLPEIKKRVRSGAIAEASLPLQVREFRVVQPGAWHMVELNEEVQLKIQVKTKKAIEAEQLVRLGDIDSGSCVLEPPVVDGAPRSCALNMLAMSCIWTMLIALSLM